jgi:gas vesicle protein
MEESVGSFVPGVILGAIAGAAVALLTTPRSGRENRELLKTRFPEAGEEAPELLERLKEEIRQRVETGRQAFQQGKDETRAQMMSEFEQGRRRGSDALRPPPRPMAPPPDPT